MSHLYINIIFNPHPITSFLFNTTSTYITSTSIHIHIYPQSTSYSSSAGSSDRIFFSTLSSRVCEWLERGLEDRFFFKMWQTYAFTFWSLFLHLLLFVESIFFFLTSSSSFWIRNLHLLFVVVIFIILSIKTSTTSSRSRVVVERAFEPFSFTSAWCAFSPHRACLLLWVHEPNRYPIYSLFGLVLFATKIIDLAAPHATTPQKVRSRRDGGTSGTLTEMHQLSRWERSVGCLRWRRWWWQKEDENQIQKMTRKSRRRW